MYVVAVQGGPLPVVSRVITPHIGGITPVYPSYPFIRPFIGVITPFRTIVGAHLVACLTLLGHLPDFVALKEGPQMPIPWAAVDILVLMSCVLFLECLFTSC